MYLNSEKKKEIFAASGFTKTAADTGSPESQIALFTHRIVALTGHLQTNKKDHSTRRGLLMLVGKRKKLLSYLQQNDIARYRAILANLNLRK